MGCDLQKAAVGETCCDHAVAHSFRTAENTHTVTGFSPGHLSVLRGALSCAPRSPEVVGRLSSRIMASVEKAGGKVRG